MRRLLATAAVLVAAAVLALGGTGASDGPKAGQFWVEFDNAFGLVSGGDLKIAGVRAGKVGELKIDRKTHRALVELQIEKTGFGSLRTDVTCESRPQSLIGEYFVDCQPGTAREELRPGSTIPVSHTSSTVAPDLVNNVLRRPYRERLSLIVNELGAAVAGNAENLNSAIRRAAPGLRETDKVLRILAEQSGVITDLIENADTVISDLAANRKDVARFVVEARDTSRASAERRDDIAEGFRRLPGFLQELRPTLRNLGRVTDEQGPALQTLSAASDDLETFFARLGPFADASRPAFRALGGASQAGSRAIAPARKTLAELDRFAEGTPELAKNLAIILEHLDDRENAVEDDPRSPGGKGYTGLEALLQYVFDQVQSINIYDQSVHILKVSPFESPCANYADIQQAKPLLEQCGAALGPRSAGINYPDTTRPAGADEATTRATRVETRRGGDAGTTEADPAAGPAPANSLGAMPGAKRRLPAVPKLSDIIPGAPPVVLPTPPKQVPSVPGVPRRDAETQDRLLSYLLAP